MNQNFLVEASFECIITPMIYVAEHTKKYCHSPLNMFLKTFISAMLKCHEFYVAGISTMYYSIHQEMVAKSGRIAER